MKAYQKRVVSEKKALDEKLESLKEFLRTDACKSLPGDERNRLHRQSWAMSEYSAILESRIVWFKAGAEKVPKKPRKKVPKATGYTESALPGNTSLAQLWHIGGVR